MRSFVKRTLVGGLIFLLPLAVVSILLDHALKFALKGVEPVSHALQLERMGKVAGIGAATLIAVSFLILVAFGAGLAARTRWGDRLSQWVEESLFGNLPQYKMVKSMADGLAKIESGAGLKPALVSIEGGWQIGYLLEKINGEWVAVFIPQAPTPLSGNVMYLPKERARALDIGIVEAMTIVRHIGVGSSTALKGIDLTPPADP